MEDRARHVEHGLSGTVPSSNLRRLERLTHDNTGLNVICQFEIGMPLRSHEMEISTALAQRVSAEQANLAAYAALSNALLPGMACERFKTILKGSMPKAIAGARVKADCDPALVPVEVMTMVTP